MNNFLIPSIGFLTSLLFPPYFIFPLGFIIFPYLCLFIEKKLVKANKTELFIYSFIFSIGFFTSFLFWIHNPFLVFEETIKILPIVTLLILLLSFIFSSIFTIFIFYNTILPIVYVLPIIFVTSEFIISRFLYGFPWLSFSLIVSNIDFFLFLIKNFGTLITSYLLIQIYCIPFLLFSKKVIINFKYFFILVILPLLIVLILNNFQTKPVNLSNKKIIEFEIFQINKKINTDNNHSKKTLSTILGLIKKSNADVLIFSENNYPYIVDNNEIAIIQNYINNHQLVIIGGTRVENNNYYNSLFSIIKNNYNYFDKQILVPFGEFLPFRNFIPFFEKISGPYDFSIGEKNRLIETNHKFNFIPAICYEIIFYWKLINNSNFDSELIINITNDIWFGKYLGPYQHLYLTKLRAAEFNKNIIRSSNNGISAIIDSDGKIISNSSLNKFGNIKGKVNLEHKNNFFLSHFYLNIYFFNLLIIIILINLIKKSAYKKKL